MVSSVLEQYSIADFIEWEKENKIVINREFQRRDKIWPAAANSYLIDTILRELPMPKIYIRTRIDVKSKKSIREIVDGQQRLGAIFRFADDALVLSNRTKEFEGLTYSTLPDEYKQKFLTYPISVDQLINANDQDVLEIFARLNSYNVKLNQMELRHAEFQGDFKWSVHEASQKWNILWEEFNIVSLRQRLRMHDDSFMAELFSVLLNGVTDGGQRNINNLYKKYEDRFEKNLNNRINQQLDVVLKIITKELAPAVSGRLAGAPHFLMLFAAVAHAKLGIPQGDLDSLPKRNGNELTKIDVVILNLQKISEIISSYSTPKEKEFINFWRASTQTTQRIASRRIRFPVYYRCLWPETI